ncbi:RNA polymerase sigma factor [Sphaerisporangium dianthi]|uniref:RNA polymerase sigma factor n=1 Tax=Sphaerisporangium dianthi TaxID=1436120 RepID=A0ABV9CWE7_9ACTN
MLRRDDPAAAERLCREYGDRLHDYCRSVLEDDQAATATAGAIRGALAQGHRLNDPTRLRAWLYALARAECQAHQDSAGHKGAHARRGLDGAPELAHEVLACLEPREREILDLTLRHGLKSDEVARVLDISVDAVESAARLGRRHAEQWLAAVMDARGGEPRCPVLPGLVRSWAESPTRLLRAHITRHVRSCKQCESAISSVTMTALMTRMPILASPAPCERLFAGASFTAAETRTESWHPDGFPVQPDALEDPPAPEAPLSVEEGFTPERSGAESAAEFWEPDPEADDPESRIRWGRVLLVTVVSVAAAGVLWSLLFTPTGGNRPVEVEAAGGTIVITPGESLPPLVESPPPPPSGSRPASTPTGGKSSARTTGEAPGEPPPPPKPSPKPTPASTPKRGTQPKTKRTDAAPPPFFSAHGKIDVGYRREGVASIRSSAGTIRWSAAGPPYVIASPAGGTLGDGERGTFRVDLQGLAPATPSDCDRPLSTYVNITWSGDNKGILGSGSATVTITYRKPCPTPR